MSNNERLKEFSEKRHEGQRSALRRLGGDAPWEKNSECRFDPETLLTGRWRSGHGSWKNQRCNPFDKNMVLIACLLEEGGRNSRGSVGNMRKYVTFLNELHASGPIDFELLEAWWIERVREFFLGQALRPPVRHIKSLRAVDSGFAFASRKAARAAPVRLSSEPCCNIRRRETEPPARFASPASWRECR